MKSRQEFIDAYCDQLAGFLVSAFGQADKGDITQKGIWMQARLKSIRPMLDQMYGFIMDEVLVQETGRKTVDEQISGIISLYLDSQPEVRKSIVAKLRTGMNPPPRSEVNGNEKVVS